MASKVAPVLSDCRKSVSNTYGQELQKFRQVVNFVQILVFSTCTPPVLHDVQFAWPSIFVAVQNWFDQAMISTTIAHWFRCANLAPRTMRFKTSISRMRSLTGRGWMKRRLLLLPKRSLIMWSAWRRARFHSWRLESYLCPPKSRHLRWNTNGRSCMAAHAINLDPISSGPAISALEYHRIGKETNAILYSSRQRTARTVIRASQARSLPLRRTRRRRDEMPWM